MLDSFIHIRPAIIDFVTASLTRALYVCLAPDPNILYSNQECERNL